MATRYGRTFTTRRGRRGRYKYVNGRKVSFEATRNRSKRNYRSRKNFKSKRVYSSDGTYYNRRY